MSCERTWIVWDHLVEATLNQVTPALLIILCFCEARCGLSCYFVSAASSRWLWAPLWRERNFVIGVLARRPAAHCDELWCLFCQTDWSKTTSRWSFLFFLYFQLCRLKEGERGHEPSRCQTTSPLWCELQWFDCVALRLKESSLCDCGKTETCKRRPRVIFALEINIYVILSGAFSFRRDE